MNKKHFNFSYVHIVAFGFLLIIILGTVLLMLPIASKNDPVKFSDAFFTAASATCVTGLVVFDTFTKWTVFGQLVILVLIQIGGLGFMTMIAMFSFLFGKNIGLRARDLLKESINGLQFGGIIPLIKKVLLGTLIIEGTGTILLAWRFIPVFGWAKGIYYGIFHSVSAFCNAGFDLMGCIEPYSSFVPFYQDSIVMLVLSMLIIIGGIGFIVWDDITKNKLNFRNYRLHSKIVLIFTAGITICSTVLILCFENNNELASLNAWDKFAVSFFSAVTPRTAGFNAINTGMMTGGSKFITMLLMAIGGSPGSTAGGIKTSTIASLFIVGWSSIRRNKSDNIFGRRIDDTVIKRCSAVIVLYVCLIVFGTVVICALENSMNVTEVVFEVISASSTVGMTLGITQKISVYSRWVLAILMYIGRVGSVSFFAVFAQKRISSPIILPKEDISVG